MEEKTPSPSLDLWSSVLNWRPGAVIADQRDSRLDCDTVPAVNLQREEKFQKYTRAIFVTQATHIQSSQLSGNQM